jgi:hypothetical protein
MGTIGYGTVQLKGNTCEEKKWFLNKPVKLYMSKNVYTMTEKY